MPEKLTSKDYRFILICAVVAAVCLAVTARYFYAAFPEASINFAVTREQSTPIAETFLQRRNLSAQGYRHGVIFDYDDRAKVFLEKEMGLEQANQLLSTKIKLWRWSHRWFRPLQKEELQVDVSPRGDVVRFTHPVREEDPGASLSQEAARPVAETFLTQVMHKDLAALDFVEATSEQRPRRMDHTFTWKDRVFSFQDSSYRYEVTIQGDQVGGYNEFLKVPEAWTREYQRLRSLNEAAGSVDSGAFVLLGLGMLVVFVQRLRRKDIRWATAGLFAVITAGLSFLASLNEFPLAEFYYETTQSYGSFFTETMLDNLFRSLGAGAFIFLITAAAEPLYRERYKEKLSLTNLFRRRGLRTKRSFLSIILGLTMTAFFVAYQIVFYLAAHKLGAWSPADVPYSDLLNTKLPWVFVLLGGFFPAVFEEFAFRMFSIPFLQKLLKSGWAAIILAGFIWGFGHAAYPNQPFYIRGLEVGLAGVVIGVIMVRFGILAPLIWHYTVDAVYSALLMLRSDNLYFIISGAATALIFLVPLFVSVIAYIRTGTFESEVELTNEREGTADEVREPRVETGPAAPMMYAPLSTRRVLIGAIIVAVLLSLYLVPVGRVGDFVDYKITGDEARDLAGQFLKSRGADAGAFQSVVFAFDNFDELTAKYVLLHRDVRALNDLLDGPLRSGLWAVRFFRPLEKEEYRVYINPRDQSVYGFERVMAEDAPGADLERAAAMAVATAYLQSGGTNSSDFDLADYSTEKRPKRRDHTFVWQAKEGDPRNVGEAKFRLRVLVQGDQIGHIRRSLKLPEEWVREQQKSTVVTTTRSWTRTLTLAMLVMAGIVIFVARARRGKIRWKHTVLLAVGVTGIMVLGRINDFPTRYAHYPTTVPPQIFMVTQAISLIWFMAYVFIAGALIFGVMTSVYPEALRSLRQPERGRLGRDAVIGAGLVIGTMFGVGRLSAFLVGRFHAYAAVPDFPGPGHLDAALPLASTLVTAVQGTVLILSVLGLVVYLARQYVKRPALLVIGALVVLLVLVSPEAKSPREYLLALAMNGLSLAAAAALVRWVLRGNRLAYLASVFLFFCFQGAVTLVGQSAAFFRLNGFILLGVVAAVVGWLWMSQSTAQNRGQEELR